ncbi:hypothetical protein MM817_02511 [Acidibacillus sp. S0AB]|uniref:Uncharacterized protein n=1 Tax=Sulfoacidibacillus ferrooxidans TaxID=2005001 RepID=A0A9X1V9F2_9BACL|nr:hypothetical protein [Sulfoacidibacillus ferrooxidans]
MSVVFPHSLIIELGAILGLAIVVKVVTSATKLARKRKT